MSIHPPAWLSVEFVEGVLKVAENDDSIKVIDFTSNPATANGDNYMSELLRTGVKYTRNRSGRKRTEKKSLIMKIFPTKMNSNEDLVKEAFKTEVQMMGTNLVKMNDILNEKDYRLSPRILYTNIGDPTLLVMEDLAELGFRMGDRQAGLDLQHCILVMRGLAKLHASSVAIYEQDPSSIDMYQKGVFHNDSSEALKNFIRNGIKAVANEVANWTELNPSYSEKLLKLSTVCYEKAAKCTRRKDDELNVINHGDCWINNMLFRYDNAGKVISHIFVDFQACVWNSPTLDILQFLSTSPVEEVALHHRDELLDEYLNVLSQTMSRLGCTQKPPSMESLQKSLKEREFLTVISSCIGLPFLLVDKTEVISLEEMMGNDNDYVNPVYKGEAYRKIMLKRLIEWNSRGLLDS